MFNRMGIGGWKVSALTAATGLAVMLGSRANAQCSLNSSSGTGPGLRCDVCTLESQSTFSVSTNWVATFSCVPTTSPAFCSPVATIYNIPVAICEVPPGGSPGCCPNPLQYFCTSAGSDTGDAMIRTIQASAAPTSPAAGANAASASGTCTAGGGNTSASVMSELIETETQVGWSQDLRLGLATSATAQSWLLPSGCQVLTFIPTATFSAMSSSMPGPCDPQLSLPGASLPWLPAPGSRPIFIWGKFVATVTHTGGATQTSTQYGMYKVDDGLNHQAWGVFNHSAVSVTVGSNSIAVDAHDIPIPMGLDLTDSTELDFSANTKAMGPHDGNVDGTVGPFGKVDWCDRKMMYALQGATFGTAAYTPEADFNLDGVIDAADLALFWAYFDDMACPADYDCSGTVTTSDIMAFLGDWFAGAPAADFDRSGTVDSADIFAFLGAWFAGCSIGWPH